MFAASLFALAALAPSVFATVSMTAPTESTSWPAGQQQTINWMDNGEAPSLTDLGPCSVGIYAGNAIQQTLLQEIVPSVDVSTTASISFTPDPSIGPNTNVYFIRFTSLTAKDPTNAMYAAESFSAKFTLTGMTGTFNSTVQAQVDAAASASSGAASTPAAAASSTGAAASTPAASGSSTPASAANSGSASHTSSAASKSASATAAATNGAAGRYASAGAVGAAVALAGAMLL